MYSRISTMDRLAFREFNPAHDDPGSRRHRQDRPPHRRSADRRTARLARHRIRLERAFGVKRLVLLSGRGEPEAQRAERELAAAGVPWTIVRCSWFAQNFSEDFLAEAVLAGAVAVPAGAIP